MSLRGFLIFVMLSTIVASMAIPGLNASHQASSSRAKTGRLPAVFLPVQSKNVKGLGVGKVLVASRGLADPHFAHTVVLLVRYDAEGVVGLILNRRTDVPLSRALDLKGAKGRSDPVYLGGPVETPAVFALLQSPAKVEGAEHIFGGVYLITSKTLFEKTFSARPEPGVFHVYLGYAGWTSEQLRNEVEMGAWFIFPGDTSTVFNSDPDSSWPQMIRKTELQLAGSEPTIRDPGRTSGFAVDLCPPPSDAHEEKTPVVKKFGRLAFEGMTDELEGPPDQEQGERIEPQAVVEDTGDKKGRREQDGRNAQRMADAVHRMLMAGGILRDPLLVGASA